MMQRFLLALVLLGQAEALVPTVSAPAAVRTPAAARRAVTVRMGEASTKKANEWKDVKSINDYGKEQTYMFLGAKDDDEETYSTAASKPLLSYLGLNLGPFDFITAPYFIVLFSPFLLCAVAATPWALSKLG